MLRNVLVLVLLVSLVAMAGCLTKPISYIGALAGEVVHPNGPVSSFIYYGPGSDEFNRALEHTGAHARTLEANMNSIVDDWDKHFLLYDQYDPFSE